MNYFFKGYKYWTKKQKKKLNFWYILFIFHENLKILEFKALCEYKENALNYKNHKNFIYVKKK